ncbi:MULTISPECIES: hypothetical protein [Pseudomonas]|uniref:hypothetical protein n=1 Tax=Pseudomonas TaxID=286 RepID=UPI0015DCA3C6|nr:MULTISPECIES: hypothetical protein [Pseudomonas]MEB3839272.1 hypothetical protein [Pseudomonas guariconensis]MEB3872140.1 hypothetical protein [Pseudomonas guariconensis]MEB3880059.1 hypothetical protein [Pseudomonas guariconensis]MEB3896292.1 hypothetical protein [Pseudomonas guariconensis]BBR52274.1 hypothetical protein WP4W18C03_06010 [Pseudomonas putida]
MNKHRAAVAGSSLVAFLPGITLAQRQAVLSAALMAERVTRTDHDEGLVTDWFSHYRRQLQFYGWDAVSAQQVHWPELERPGIVNAALRRIEATAGERYSTAVKLAMNGLALNDWPLLNFEQRTRERGVFQLLPCAPGKPGYVDLVLYHERCETDTLGTGFLFRNRQGTRVQAELVRFNTRLFDQQFRELVERRLEKIARQQILSFEI